LTSVLSRALELDLGSGERGAMSGSVGLNGVTDRRSSGGKEIPIFQISIASASTLGRKK
jgi:hypothetical protein